MSFELPVRFDPEWLSRYAWRPTEYSKLELSELGVLRRPKTAQIPGTLVYASPNKNFPPRYRITKLGGTKEKYTVDVEVAMKKVFGRFLNKKLLEYDYLCNLRVLCMEYNSRYFSRSMERESKLLGENPSPITKKHLCAGVNGKTCGKMIYDYRCPSCWLLVRGGFIDDKDDSSYSLNL